MTILRGVIFLLMTVAAIGFAIQNDQAVSLHYYFGWVTFPLPLFLLAFLAFLMGLVVSGLMASLSKLGLQARLRHQKKWLAELEQKRNDGRLRPSS